MLICMIKNDSLFIYGGDNSYNLYICKTNAWQFVSRQKETRRCVGLLYCLNEWTHY